MSSARRSITARDASGQPVTVGPVHTDASVAALQQGVLDFGWTVTGASVHYSAAQFRELRKRGAQREVTAEPG